MVTFGLERNCTSGGFVSMNKKRNQSDPPTVDRIRWDISAGATGEKVGFPDPATAPLGTDDEAAGTPPSREERSMEAASRPQPVGPDAPSQGPTVVYLGIIAAVASVIAVAAYVLV